MDNDSKLIFEAYKLISELDIGTDWAGGPSPTIRQKIKSAPGGGYLIGSIAKSLNISLEEAADKLTAAIFPRLFKQKPGVINGKEVGYINPSRNEDQFRIAIKTAIGLALKDLKIQYPELNVPGSDALKGYTARVIANLGDFYRDYAVGGKGVVTTVKSAKEVKKAIKSAEAPAGAEQPAVPSTETTYVRGMTRFIPDFQKVFVELPDEITVSSDQDLYDTEEFNSALRDAILQAYDAKTASDKEFVTTFVDSLKYKNAYVKSDAKKEKEGEGTGEISTLDSDDAETPTDILKDLGAWEPDTGFDDFDRYSTT